MKINFIFCRHGFSCSNATSSLYRNNILTSNDVYKINKQISGDKQKDIDLFIDPELTQIGIDASAYNGCIVSKTIRQIGFDYFKNDEFSSINIVGCSPLIRAMETANEMTKTWSNKPDKIYVFPHLRELNESGKDKYSRESQRIMDINPAYAMKTIDQQKEYLKNINLDNIIDFTYVENDLKNRSKAGDIPKFIEWFLEHIVSNIEEPINKLNVFIITHAGVLTHFEEMVFNKSMGFENNSGFIVSVIQKENKNEYDLTEYISLRKYLPKTFFKSYSDDKYTEREYYCPSKRCATFCKYIKHDNTKNISKIDLPECSNTNQTNLNTINIKIKKE